MSAKFGATSPLRRSLFRHFTLLVTFALALFTFGYVQFGLYPVVDRVAGSQFIVAADQVDSSLRHSLDPAETLLAVAHEWASATTQFDEDRPEPFNRLAKSILGQSAHFTSVVAGTSDGLGWMLLELPGGRWMNRFTNIPARGNAQRFIDWAADGSMQQRQESADYDPRSRPWYRGAMMSTGPSEVHWTDPYILFTTRDPGITASIRMDLPDAKSRVLGIDIKLLDISRAASSVPVSANGFSLVLTDDDRLLAPHRDSFNADDESIRALALRPATALNNPIVDTGIAQWRSLGQPSASVLRFSNEGASWLASFRQFRRGKQIFWVGVFAPESDFLRAWKPMAQALVLMFGLVLVLTFVYALRYTTRFSEPLESLAAASARIAQLDFRPGTEVRSGIAEIAQLASAQDQMRMMLDDYRTTVTAQSEDLQQQIDALRAAEAQMEHLSQHDPLTGLPNRLLLNDRLSNAVKRAERRGSKLAVLFLDLDRFKAVNDSQGHPIGDKLLCIVAKRLTRAMRASDSLARLGGDEFVVMAEDILSGADAEALATTMLTTLDRALAIDGRTFHLTGSVGISLYPDDGLDPVTLIRNADAAMYQAKARGRNTYCFYTAEMTLQLVARMQLEQALHAAIVREEFELRFQPQVNMATGSVIGVEALVRWAHPEQGLILPTAFISLAEEAGMIGRIGAWVLEESCRQFAEWTALGMVVPRIAVNLSVKQLQGDGLPALVARVLATTGVPAKALELEVTESFFLESPDAFATLMEIGRSGVSFALDDFGTGYSSLGYLKKLPLARLKIDREFISDIGQNSDGETVIRAIISLAVALGREVIAEGVETLEQSQFLLKHGCEQAQGHYYSPALSAQEFQAWWAERKAAESSVSDPDRTT